MITDRATMTAGIRKVVAEYGRLSIDVAQLSDHDDLYRAGLSSHASVNLMLGLEDAYDLEFPERFLRRATFESMAAICNALEELLQGDG